MKARERETKWKIIFAVSVLKLYILHQFCVCIREGQGKGLDCCGSLQLERAQPQLGCLFPASSHLEAPWQIGNEWSTKSNPQSSTVWWSPSLLVSSEGGNLPLLLLKGLRGLHWQWKGPGWLASEMLPFISRVYSILSLPTTLAKPKHRSSSDLTSHPQLPVLQPLANAYFSTSWLWSLWTLWYEIKC